MPRTSAIAQGREAFARRNWREAYAQLSAADRELSLEPADLERFATAVWGQAQRVIRHVDARQPEEAARGFIDYWAGSGAYDAMEAHSRATVTAGMSKLRNEWLTAFEVQGATLEMLAAFSMPVQLVAGSHTTPAARAVVEVLRGIWPAAYAEIAGA